MKTSLSLMTGLLVLASNLQAQTTWYITPSGAGSQNGTSWTNAFSGSTDSGFTTVINNTMQPGDTLMIGGSTVAPTSRAVPAGSTDTFLLPPDDQLYKSRVIVLGSGASGTPSAPKTLLGVSRNHGPPVFLAVSATSEAKAFDLVGNCSNLNIKNLDIKRYRVAIAVTGSAQTNLKFEKINTDWMKDGGFYFNNASDMEIRDCTATRYRSYGFWAYSNCHRIKFFSCVADATQGDANWISKTDSPIGFSFHVKNEPFPKNTDILLENCTSKNNFGLTGQGSFKQGDGFMVQGENDGITFRKCVADGTSDSGYDLKGRNQTINDSVAVNCKFAGVKIWSGGTFNNFASVNNGKLFFYAQSGTIPIVVNNSTLHSGTSTQVGIYVQPINRESSFNNCLFTFAGAAGNYTAVATDAEHPEFTPAVATSRFANTGTVSGTAPPRYNNPIIPWDGKGTNYDNQTFGMTKGYNSTRVTPLPELPVGRIISINLLNSSTNALASTDVAGFIPAPNWNNNDQPNGTMTTLVDSGSAVSGATASFYFTNYGYVNATVTHPAPMNDDSKMMRSNRANSNTASTTSTLTGLTYGKYDVYVYWGGRSNGESVPATLKVELQLLVSGTYTTVPNSARFITDANRAWDGTYNESTAETSGAAVDGNEYVVFRNLEASSFRILTTGPSRTGPSGIQIVERP